jgi:hypothetical protein
VPHSPAARRAGAWPRFTPVMGHGNVSLRTSMVNLEPPVWGSWAGLDAVTLSQSMQAIRRGPDRSHHAGALDFLPDICLNAWAATMSEVLRPKSRQGSPGPEYGGCLDARRSMRGTRGGLFEHLAQLGATDSPTPSRARMPSTARAWRGQDTGARTRGARHEGRRHEG